MGTSDTLRSVIDAGRSSKRLDELSYARVIAKVAMHIHTAQQKAGAGKAVGPITPIHIRLAASGEVTLELSEGAALGYSSPEQLSGTFGDRRSDVFSLGSVLWEVLTHQRLFDAMNDAAVRMAVTEREIQSPSEINANVPAELSAICLRALSRNPTDRYQSLKSMAVEIEEFLEEAGYADDDAKIAKYLKVAKDAIAKAAASPPPAERPASNTQPPPTMLKQPATPTLLGQEPRPNINSGAALAAALANASSNGLPAAASTSTAIGVPKAAEWQDTGTPAHAPPPVTASHAQVDPKVQASASLSSASSASLRSDKATISVAVPPQVKVATVEAKHVEAKATAETPSVIVDAMHVEAKPSVVVEPLVDTKPTLIDAKPPEVIARAPSQGEAAAKRPPTNSETTAKRAPTNSEATAKRAPTNSDGSPKRPPTNSDLPQSANAVSLPGGADVLAGWGWGTDNHNAIAPEGYDDDAYDAPASNPKKVMVKVFGGALGVALLIIVVAFAFGGSSSKGTKTAAKQTDTARTAVDPPAPPPVPAVAAATPEPGSAAAPVQTEAEKAAAAKVAAEAAAADKAAADKAEADRIAADKAAAAQTEADRIAAEKEAKKLEAARIAADKAATAKAEAERIAAEKEAKKQEAARLAADKAAAAKAEAARVAAEKQAKKQADAARAATTAAAKPKTEVTHKAEPTRVAKAEPEPTAAAKVDVEAAYRQGLQLFARGDTAGALASLRAALAANPSYAPTWRGLGLVFEKMGEKDQARAAFKRYLQLAPTAGDTEQIRGRLERLGS